MQARYRHLLNTRTCPGIPVSACHLMLLFLHTVPGPMRCCNEQAETFQLVVAHAASCRCSLPDVPAGTGAGCGEHIITLTCEVPRQAHRGNMEARFIAGPA